MEYTCRVPDPAYCAVSDSYSSSDDTNLHKAVTAQHRTCLLIQA